MTNITSFGAFVDIWSERQRLGARLAVVRQVCARPHGGGFAGSAGDGTPELRSGGISGEINVVLLPEKSSEQSSEVHNLTAMVS